MIKKISLSLLGIILLLIVVFALGHRFIVPKLIPLSDLPEPLGFYPIGTQIFEWTDPARNEWFTEQENDKRRIVVQIWYPSEPSNEAPLPYLPYPDRWLPALSDILELPQFLFNHLIEIDTHSTLNAKPNQDIKQAPLVIFSHGIYGFRFQNTAQFEALASRGYIVISADHAYDASLTFFEDGSIADFRSGYEGELTEEEFWALRNPQLSTRVADIRFMLDTIENKQNAGKTVWSVIDLERIGIFGHSYGGATGIVAAGEDKRIDAVVALDGWILPILPVVIEKGVQKPFFYIGRESWPDPLNYQKLNTLLHNSSQQSTLYLPGTMHFDFSDTPLFSPAMQAVGLAGAIPADELARLLENNIVTFFDTHLSHKSII
ncbi:MAG: dienelactone hydrolase family protein [Gammaproteobacteria bacterium]|nr:dienelactone hydrolase family protein [Gammaproteobacteria bacterium]